MSDPIRKLAEEIALWGAAGSVIPHEAHSDHWEARLRAALPVGLSKPGYELVSDLLGELAVAREALEEVANKATCIDVEGYDCRSRWSGQRGREFWCESCVAADALSSDSGRLAAELIRAAVEGHLLDESVDNLVSHEKLTDADNKQEIPDLVEEFNRASAKRQTSHQRQKLAADALLSAFPGLREEVERGG